MFFKNIKIKNEGSFLRAYIEQARVVDEKVSFPIAINGNYKEILEKKMFKYLIESEDTEIQQFFTRLDLSGFDLKELPNTLFSFSRVEEMDLSKNKLSTLSADFWRAFPKLKKLDVLETCLGVLGDDFRK